MTKFDDDIERDLDAGNTLSLALIAQDLRDTIAHVSTSALAAAYRKKERTSVKRTQESDK